MWIDEFIKHLSGSVQEDIDFERAFSIKNANLPRFVYKYRRCNDYAFDNLKTDTVWLTSASSYNDPYDCAITLSFRQLNAAIVKMKLEELPYYSKLRTMVSEEELNAARLSSDPVRQVSKLLLRSTKDLPEDKLPAMLQSLEDAVEHVSRPTLERARKLVQDNTMICSFSAVHDSIIMWGHYAQDHKGFCIEYDVLNSFDHIRRRMLCPVVYSNDLFDATKYFEAAILYPTKFNNTFAVVAALYKSPEWKYEQEWRLIYPGGIVPTGNYAMGTPSRVFLGSRIADADRMQLTAICRANKIECHQMRLSANSFKLESEPC